MDYGKNPTEKKNNSIRQMGSPGISSGVYGLAFIGAAIYFISHASSFWIGVLGFFKALFWPAVLIYKLLEFWNM